VFIYQCISLLSPNLRTVLQARALKLCCLSWATVCPHTERHRSRIRRWAEHRKSWLYLQTTPCSWQYYPILEIRWVRLWEFKVPARVYSQPTMQLEFETRLNQSQSLPSLAQMAPVHQGPHRTFLNCHLGNQLTDITGWVKEWLSLVYWCIQMPRSESGMWQALSEWINMTNVNSESVFCGLCRYIINQSWNIRVDCLEAVAAYPYVHSSCVCSPIHPFISANTYWISAI
jgi:hypothetical protein